MQIDSEWIQCSTDQSVDESIDWLINESIDWWPVNTLNRMSKCIYTKVVKNK